MQRNKQAFFRFTWTPLVGIAPGERLEEFRCVRLRAQGLFMRRADGLVGARAADETRIGRKFPGSNVSGGFLHDLLSLVELFRIAGAHLDLIVLQIVKDQADGVPFENLFRRKRVETELQIFLRVSILFWLACFVVNDLDIFRLFHRRTVFARQRIHLVHSPDDGYAVLQRQFETLFLLQHSRGRLHHRGVERTKLLDAVLFVFCLLVFVFKSFGTPFHLKEPLQLFEWELVASAEFADETLDGAVHDAAETQSGFWAFFQRPKVSEQVSLRADAIAIHGRWAQRERLRRLRVEALGPFRNPAENLRGSRGSREELRWV